MSEDIEWKSAGLYEVSISEDNHIYLSPATKFAFTCAICGASARDCDEIIRHAIFECDVLAESF